VSTQHSRISGVLRQMGSCGLHRLVSLVPASIPLRPADAPTSLHPRTIEAVRSARNIVEWSRARGAQGEGRECRGESAPSTTQKSPSNAVSHAQGSSTTASPVAPGGQRPSSSDGTPAPQASTFSEVVLELARKYQLQSKPFDGAPAGAPAPPALPVARPLLERAPLALAARLGVPQASLAQSLPAPPSPRLPQRPAGPQRMHPRELRIGFTGPRDRWEPDLLAISPSGRGLLRPSCLEAAGLGGPPARAAKASTTASAGHSRVMVPIHETLPQGPAMNRASAGAARMAVEQIASTPPAESRGVRRKGASPSAA